VVRHRTSAFVEPYRRSVSKAGYIGENEKSRVPALKGLKPHRFTEHLTGDGPTVIAKRTVASLAAE
jgi:hypothetical protein